jgi:2-methylisocitrate lyase-like PEP mutase family enzyme
MIMAPRSIDDLKKFRDGVQGPLAVTVGSWPFNVTKPELERLGYQLALFTVSTLRRMIVVTREVLAKLKQDGGLDHSAPAMISMNEMHRLLGQEQVKEWEKRYS